VVTYTVGGIAVVGTDYAALSGSATIPAGARSGYITLSAKQNALKSGNRDLVLNLQPATGYSLSPSSARMVILDNDVPTVGISAIRPVATEGGTNSLLFRVTRTGPLTNSLSVNYTTAGTGVAGTNYTALTGNLTIPAGSAAAEIVVTPIENALGQGNTTVVLNLIRRRLAERFWIMMSRLYTSMPRHLMQSQFPRETFSQPRLYSGFPAKRAQYCP
jgi:hypothetical protein